MTNLFASSMCSPRPRAETALGASFGCDSFQSLPSPRYQVLLMLLT